MQARMMQQPLIVSSLLAHAARYHGDAEIVSRTVEGPGADDGVAIVDGIHRYTYADAHRRAGRLANALSQMGIGAGDRVATLAWNGYRHFELYYAVSGMGAVTHTLNPRLFPEQIAWIINDAQDRIVFFDISFAGLIEQIAPQCPGVERWDV